MSKLNKNNESFYILLIIFGCLQQLISSELLTLIGIVYFIFLVIQSKIRIKLGWSKPIIILLLIFLIGSFVGLKNFYSRNYLRDIYYCINPIIILFIGMNLSNNKTENNKLLNSVVAISVLSSLFSSILATVSILEGNNFFNLRKFFEYVMWGNVISIGILITKISEKNGKKDKAQIISLVFLIIVSILGMSRTVWVEIAILLLILFLSSKKKAKFFLKYFKIFFILSVVSFFVIVNIPSKTKTILINKILNSFNEVNYNNHWTSTKIQKNWRGYEISQAKVQFNKGTLLQKIIGYGFGKGIYVGRYSMLVHQTGEYIYIIHNGFYNILIKEGIVGLLIYILFYLEIIIYSFKSYMITKNKKDLLIVGITLCLIVYTYLVKGIFADFQQINALLVIGGWLRLKRKNNDEIAI